MTDRRSVLLLTGVMALVSPLVFHLLIITAVLIGAWRLRRALTSPGARRALRRVGFLRRWVGPSASASVTGSVLRRDEVYLGVDALGDARFSRPERAVLLLGPPRSGKTSGVIVPTVLCHDGPVVSTSTKPDVLTGTAAARSAIGEVWQFEPTGAASDRPGVRRLGWSPVTASRGWDGALLMARAMVSGAAIGTGSTDGSHWARRAQAVLAPLLHAAAITDRSVEDVVDWVARHEADEPGALLEQTGGSRMAVRALLGVANTERRERASIFSSAADALDAYTSSAALASALDPNFDADRFVHSHDTIYVHAPADRQQLAAPLVCGLLSEIRRATYRAHAAGYLQGSVLFALDEVANIAPIVDLPQIASEGGGQGLILLAALQDLSQARGRWGAAADGFLTLFGTKALLPGIADQRTLEAVSVMLGEYDRTVVSHTRSRSPGSWSAQNGETTSTQRTRVLSPGEVANIPAGSLLHLDGVVWEPLSVTPAHSSEPWRTLTDNGRGQR